MLPQLEIKTKRIKAPILPKLTGLTVNAKPNAYKFENDVLTNEDTENEVLSQAMLESQLGALTRSRDTSPSYRSREQKQFESKRKSEGPVSPEARTENPFESQLMKQQS